MHEHRGGGAAGVRRHALGVGMDIEPPSGLPAPQAQPPDIVKSFYKDREVTLRGWAARPRCRCGQIGVGVALREMREARNWMRER
jgi:hypothetical protein